MRFIVDECTGPQVARWLEQQGFEVFSVYDHARGSSDDEIIRKARLEDWIILTNDKDFGEKIFKGKKLHKGVVLLRLEDERAQSKIHVLGKLLQKYHSQIPNHYVVAAETRIRIVETDT